MSKLESVQTQIVTNHKTIQKCHREHGGLLCRGGDGGQGGAWGHAAEDRLQQTCILYGSKRIKVGILHYFLRRALVPFPCWKLIIGIFHKEKVLVGAFSENIKLNIKMEEAYL